VTATTLAIGVEGSRCSLALLAPAVPVGAREV